MIHRSGIQAVPVLYTNEGGTLRTRTGMALGMLVRLAECVYDEVHRVSSVWLEAPQSSR